MDEMQEVDLSTFTQERYAEGFEEQQAYIYTIYNKKGTKLDRAWVSRMRDNADSQTVARFFKESGYGPDTKLGQLVQMLVCEESLKNAITGGGGIKGRVAPKEEYDATLQQIRVPRRTVATDIFGSEAAQFTQQLGDAFFFHRQAPGSRYKAMQARDQQLTQVLQTVTQRFPLTSR